MVEKVRVERYRDPFVIWPMAICFFFTTFKLHHH